MGPGSGAAATSNVALYVTRALRAFFVTEDAWETVAPGDSSAVHAAVSATTVTRRKTRLRLKLDLSARRAKAYIRARRAPAREAC
jgi:hypothetical protein